MPNSIDQTTKVNLGILGTLIVIGFGGGAYLSSMKTSVDGMSLAIKANTEAVKLNTQQIQSDSKHLAVLGVSVEEIKRRLRALEK